MIDQDPPVPPQLPVFLKLPVMLVLGTVSDCCESDLAQRCYLMLNIGLFEVVYVLFPLVFRNIALSKIIFVKSIVLGSQHSIVNGFSFFLFFSRV